VSEAVARNTIDLVLAATYNGKGENRSLHSFFYGLRGEPAWPPRFGTSIYYDHGAFMKAVLYLRQNGGKHLRAMPPPDVRSLLTQFIQQHFWVISQETFGEQFDTSYDKVLSEGAKRALAQALLNSSAFAPQQILALYPLVPIRVQKDFATEEFFIIDPPSLEDHLPAGIPKREIAAQRYPPIRNWDGKVWHPSAWLGVRALSEAEANKRKSAILGSISLLPHPRYRYVCSGRPIFGGRCIFLNAANYTFDGNHTPALLEDILIGDEDHEWLLALSEKLSSDGDNVQKEIKALELFYRAWSLDPAHRFAALFPALDALFGDQDRATRALMEAIPTQCDIDGQRVRVLLKLRSSVIHGGAPNVHESDKYQRYYETYGEDPIFDLERLTARCLRSFVFGGALKQHSHPHADKVSAKVLSE
jgi:hypothetical protein